MWAGWCFGREWGGYVWTKVSCMMLVLQTHHFISWAQVARYSTHYLEKVSSCISCYTQTDSHQNCDKLTIHSPSHLSWVSWSFADQGSDSPSPAEHPPPVAGFELSVKQTPVRNKKLVIENANQIPSSLFTFCRSWSSACFARTSFSCFSLFSSSVCRAFRLPISSESAWWTWYCMLRIVCCYDGEMRIKEC